jgi:hypothetical protein
MILATLIAGAKSSLGAMLGRNGLLLAAIAGLVTFYMLADNSAAQRGRAQAIAEQGEADNEINATVAEARRIAVDPRARGVLDPYTIDDIGGEAQDPGGGG